MKVARFHFEASARLARAVAFPAGGGKRAVAEPLRALLAGVSLGEARLDAERAHAETSEALRQMAARARRAERRIEDLEARLDTLRARYAEPIREMEGSAAHLREVIAQRRAEAELPSLKERAALRRSIQRGARLEGGIR